MAGTSAAMRLKELGYTNFEIIEASDRIGGRAYNTFIDNYSLEMGPLLVHGAPDNPVLELANKYNVSYQAVDYDDWIVRSRNGTDITDEADRVYEEKFEPALENLDIDIQRAKYEERPDFSMRSAFAKAGWTPASFLEDVIEYFEIDWLYGFGPGETSGIYGDFIKAKDAADEFGEVIVKDSRGYAVIVEKLLEEAVGNDTDKLKLNTIVNNIEEKDGQIVVSTHGGERFTGDYVIVTFSLGVLQSKNVIFKPELPEWKSDAIEQFQMAQYTNVYVQFNTSFWDDSEWILYAGETDTFSVILNMNKYYPGSNILNIEASNKNAIRIERLTDDEIQLEVIATLEKIYSKANIIVPSPIEIRVSRFSTYPFSFGAWSNWPPGFTKDRHYALQAPVGRIYFGGEHTHLVYYGYLHGAYLSGIQVVDALDRCIQRSVCQRYVPLYAARGCRYTKASNYDHTAKEDNGSCKFPCVSSSATLKASFLTLFYCLLVTFNKYN